ncbi:MAG: hypothetical protein DSM106950_41270 [Stigonema ocellatum SAG 48.90 = DSM 106950]|nr:hypothetical protein [Stigonema ocellatum SAG 48.90 = DSM 106950]
MLAQFQSLYPQGSLISELVQIYHGKYIVRASVQIEGVTRATGMAAAETLEDAEDQARSRALMVLGITNTPPLSVAFSLEPTVPLNPNPTLVTTSGLTESSGYSPAINSFPQTQATTFTPSNANSLDLGQRFPVISQQEAELEPPMENWGMMSDTLSEENNLLPRVSTSNVTPFAPRSYNPPEDLPTKDTTGKKKKKSEPVDLSDVIAKTDVHIERLGWTKEYGRDYLKKTYGKLGRTLLTEDELLDFLRYLESQPTPPDPVAGF